MNISPGAESVSLIVDIVDDSGLPVTGLVAATFPPVYIVRAGEAVPTAVTLSDLAAQDSAYSSGGVKELVAGSYRFDAPNSAFATANPEVKIKGEATDKRLIHPSIKVAYEAVDLQTIKTQSVTCDAGVTVSPYVGSTGAAVNGTAANTLSGHDPGATLGTSTFDHTNDQVIVGTNNDKTGYKLASDGLDSIATTVSGVASTFPQMLVQVWRRFFKKADRDATTIQTYADDGTTVLTEQTISDSGGVETQGAASEP